MRRCHIMLFNFIRTIFLFYYFHNYYYYYQTDIWNVTIIDYENMLFFHSYHILIVLFSLLLLFFFTYCYYQTVLWNVAVIDYEIMLFFNSYHIINIFLYNILLVQNWKWKRCRVFYAQSCRFLLYFYILWYPDKFAQSCCKKGVLYLYAQSCIAISGRSNL